MLKPAMILAAIAACLSDTAFAGGCAPRETVVDELAAGFGESRQSIGLASQGTVVEVFASPETGTWTITATNVHGITCLIASGHAFEAVTAPAPGEDT